MVMPLLVASGQRIVQQTSPPRRPSKRSTWTSTARSIRARASEARVPGSGGRGPRRLRRSGAGPTLAGHASDWGLGPGATSLALRLSGVRHGGSPRPVLARRRSGTAAAGAASSQRGWHAWCHHRRMHRRCGRHLGSCRPTPAATSGGRLQQKRDTPRQRPRRQSVRPRRREPLAFSARRRAQSPVSFWRA